MAGPGPAVLVVDDDAEIREGISELLRDEGFEVVTAENGRAALDTLQGRRDIRVILLDLLMPVMDGATFRAHQLADRSIAQIPFIMLTANYDYADRAESLGAVACFRKPVKPSALLRALEQFR